MSLSERVLDGGALITALSHLQNACVVNYSHERWLALQVGVECPRFTLAEINTRNGRLVALCRGIAASMMSGEENMDCTKLEELLRLLSTYIIADHRSLVALAEKLELDSEALTMKRVDRQEQMLDEAIEATFR